MMMGIATETRIIMLAFTRPIMALFDLYAKGLLRQHADLVLGQHVLRLRFAAVLVVER